MKRIIATICIFAMLFSTTVFAVESKPTLTIDSVSANPGGSISVPIRISGNTGIAGATISITYDKALTLTKISCGEAFPNLTMTTTGNLSANPIKIMWDGEKADTSNGIIATMTFQAPNTPGEFAISATGDIVDGVLVAVAVTIQNGSIKVSAMVDNTASAISYDKSKKQVSASIVAKIYDNAPIDAVFFVAAYSNKKMLACKTISASKIYGVYNTTILMDGIPETVTDVKLMMLNSTELMVPICASVKENVPPS